MRCLLGALAFTLTPHSSAFSPPISSSRTQKHGFLPMAAVPLGSGSYVALVTPMLQSGAVDMAALEKLLQWHVAEGTNGNGDLFNSFCTIPKATS